MRRYFSAHRMWRMRMPLSVKLTMGLVGAPLFAQVQTHVNVSAHTSANTSARTVATVLTDPALRMGKLSNGLRYYIRANPTPAKRAFLWLAVDAGSLQEDDDQRGYAHFLEHMAFNGTKRFPGHKLLDVIEQAGMSFGPDLNAYTSFDETVYQLTVPTDDPQVLRQGLDILEDWAGGGILIDSAEVIAERGVVLGEWRGRLSDSASLRVHLDYLERMLGPGVKYAKRSPIGLPESIEAATSAPLQRFYQDWYRTDRIAIIAVGDFDPHEIEKHIRARFGAIPATKARRPFERPVMPVRGTTTVNIVRDLVRPSIEISWPAPAVPAAPTAAMRQRLLRELLFPPLQRTLAVQSTHERRPFVTASAGQAPVPVRAVGERLGVRVVAHPDSLVSGLAVALTELERIARNGMTPEMLATEKAAILRRYEGVAARTTAIPSRVMAEQYVQHYLTGQGQLWDGAQEIALVREILPTITSQEIAEAARAWRAGAHRIVTINFPRWFSPPALTEGGVVALLDSVAAGTAPAEFATASASQSTLSSAATKAPHKLIATPPKPGTIVREERSASTGITTWTLSNGARVIFKETTNQPDEILLHAFSQGGSSLLPDSLFFSPGRLVTMLMTASGGLGPQSHEQVASALRTTGVRGMRIDMNAFDEEIAMLGSPRELEMLFQMLYLQFTAPTVDTLELATWRRTGFGTLRMDPNDQTAGQVGGHRRLAAPSGLNVPFVDLDQAMRIYRDRYGDASDFTFYVVGAASVERVRPLVEQYLASLPSTNRATREKPMDLDIPVADNKQIIEREHPRMLPELAETVVRFGGALPRTPAEFLIERRRLSAVSWIVSRRLRNKLREEMSVTYSVGAPMQVYRTPDPRYLMVIGLTTSPEAMPASKVALWQVIKELQKKRAYRGRSLDGNDRGTPPDGKFAAEQ